MKVRFIHSADWQIGLPARFLPEEAAVRHAEARLDAARAIGRLATERKCDFVVVAGDLFDANMLERRTLRRAVEAIASIVVPVYLLPGNHDSLEPANVYERPEVGGQLPERVRVLMDSQPFPVKPGVEVVGAPWPTKRPDRDLLADAIAPLEDNGTIRIAVGHGRVDAVMGPLSDEPETIHLSSLEAAIARHAVHYVALGDRHSTTIVGSTGRIWYSGTIEPTRFDEVDPGNVLIVELDDRGSCKVEPVRVAQWQFVEHEAMVTGEEDVAAVERFLVELPNKSRTAVRLALTGTLTLRDHAALEDLLETQSETLACLETMSGRSDLVVQPDDFDFDLFGLSGFARAALTDLKEMASSTGEAATEAQGALSLLYRLARGVVV